MGIILGQPINQPPGASPPAHLGDCYRLGLRLDFYPAFQRIDYNAVLWTHPQALVAERHVQVNVGPMLHGALLADVSSYIAELFDMHADPFP